MNPLITKAIEECLPKETKHRHPQYNKAISDCKQSLPLIFKMIREEIEKMSYERLANMGGKFNDFINKKDLTTLLSPVEDNGKKE